MTAAPFTFDNSYARLPDRFFARVLPTPVAEPTLIKINDSLAAELGLERAALESADGVGILSGNKVQAGSEPIAMAYAGHQFGHFVPQLGDGRAILLGEVIGRDGVRRDVQLKGSGPTPFSRRGDGRAALGPVLREYIVGEAMAALGIATTRGLAAVVSGEAVYRETPLPGAIFTRVARGHVRVGTFQFFAARGDLDGLRTLADYVIERHYPEAKAAANPYRALLDRVIAGQATLIAQWMCVGFIHGVMNTDNMSIACETIDYGPCAFMDGYDPLKVFSSIDSMGRYAFSRQPAIAQWNLARFAETLLPLLAAEKDTAVSVAQEAISAFRGLFETAWSAGLSRKLGFFETRPGDFDFADALLTVMAETGADFTLTFRLLADAVESPDGAASVRRLFADGSAFDAWAVGWRTRLAAEGGCEQERARAMRRVNPLYIPRNHLVEEAIAAAVIQGDIGPFTMLVDVLARPFEEQPGRARHAAPPRPDEIVERTFCGT